MVGEKTMSRALRDKLLRQLLKTRKTTSSAYHNPLILEEIIITLLNMAMFQEEAIAVLLALVSELERKTMLDRLKEWIVNQSKGRPTYAKATIFEAIRRGVILPSLHADDREGLER